MEEAGEGSVSRLRGAMPTVRWVMVTALCVLPPLIALGYVCTFGVNVVYWDQWDSVVPLFEKYHQGTLTFGALYKLHNEHRMLFPRLVMLAQGLATHYHNVAEMVFGWGLLCVGAVPILSFCRQQSANALVALTAFFPASWMLFTLRQSESLLWGFPAIQFFMSIAFFLLSMHFLEKARRLDGWLMAAAAAAIVATFSAAHAVLVWPIGLIVLLTNQTPNVMQRTKAWRAGVVFWVTLGAGVGLCYVLGYAKPNYHPSLLYGFRHPLELARYLAGYAGKPLGGETAWTPVLGAFVWLSYAWATIWAFRQWRQGRRLPLLPLTMILFAGGAALLTAISRVGFGAGQAMAGRYVTISSLGLIGLYLTALPFLPRLRLGMDKHGLGAVVCGVTFLFLMRPLYNTEEGAAVRDDRTRAAYYLTNVALQSDAVLKVLHPRPSVVREGAEILRRYRLNVFSTASTNLGDLAQTDEGNLPSTIERVMGEPVSGVSQVVRIPRAAETIILVGHAQDEVAKAPAGAVFAELDETLEIPALNGLHREDLASRVGAKGYGRAGFEITFSRSLLAEGRHSLRLKVVSADKRRYCVTAERLILEMQ
jgi:hypothetical protein